MYVGYSLLSLPSNYHTNQITSKCAVPEFRDKTDLTCSQERRLVTLDSRLPDADHWTCTMTKWVRAKPNFSGDTSTTELV